MFVNSDGVRGTGGSVDADAGEGRGVRGVPDSGTHGADRTEIRDAVRPGPVPAPAGRTGGPMPHQAPAAGTGGHQVQRIFM